jgi:hypothetical protein
MLVAIKHVPDEVETFPLRQVLRPLDESDGAEGDEGRTRLKIPAFGFSLYAKNPKSVSFGKNAILLRCEVEIRIAEGPEIASPTW